MSPLQHPRSCLSTRCREHLYVSTGFGLIQTVKGLMSFADEASRGPPPYAPSSDRGFTSPCAQDLVDAIAHVRHGNTIASQHRKRVASLPTRLAGLVVGSLNTSGVGFIKNMTAVERHAELVYAETLFEKVRITCLSQPSPHLGLPRPPRSLSPPCHAWFGSTRWFLKRDGSRRERRHLLRRSLCVCPINPAHNLRSECADEHLDVSDRFVAHIAPQLRTMSSQPSGHIKTADP